MKGQMRTQLQASLQVKLNEWAEANAISQEEINRDALTCEMAKAAAAVFDVLQYKRVKHDAEAS